MATNWLSFSLLSQFHYMCLCLWVSVFVCLSVLQSKSKNLSKSVFESLSLCVLEFSSLSLRMSLSLWICLFESLTYCWTDPEIPLQPTTDDPGLLAAPRLDQPTRSICICIWFSSGQWCSYTHFCILITAVPLILTRVTKEGRSVTPYWTSKSGTGIDQSRQKNRLNLKSKACGLSQRLALAWSWNSCI